MRILVIDDDTVILDYIKELLRNEGYECDCFTRSLPALACFKLEKHAIVITDYLIPDICGVAVMRAAVALKPVVKVVVISGFSDVEEQVVNAGAYKYLPKPLDAGLLVQTVNQIAKGLAV